MSKKKRLKAHVHRHMERRLRGNKKSKKGLINDSKKKVEEKKVVEKVEEEKKEEEKSV